MTPSPPRITRRETMLAGLGCALASAAPARAASAQVAATDLGGGLTLYGGAGGNVVGLKAADGLLLVDGGAAAQSKALLSAVREAQGAAPVRYLLNTHWHPDHTGSNETLAAAGAKIVAHENTRLWMGQEITCAWENRTYPPQPARARPTETFFYDSKPLELGTTKLEYGYLPQAHTDGDVYVQFPAQNLIVAGDVVTDGRYPVVDYSTNGWLGGMVDALKALLAKCDAGTRIVPGSGGLRTKADVQAQHDMCLAVLRKISDSYYKGQTWQEFLAGKPTADFDARWGDPAVFLSTAYRGAWYHINEIRRYSR
jgi:glyoxylase-like metal-dependent hydrolase (beta-lactamase superfamily II)